MTMGTACSGWTSKMSIWAWSGSDWLTRRSLFARLGQAAPRKVVCATQLGKSKAERGQDIAGACNQSQAAACFHPQKNIAVTQQTQAKYGKFSSTAVSARGCSSERHAPASLSRNSIGNQDIQFIQHQQTPLRALAPVNSTFLHLSTLCLLLMTT